MNQSLKRSRETSAVQRRRNASRSVSEPAGIVLHYSDSSSNQSNNQQTAKPELQVNSKNFFPLQNFISIKEQSVQNTAINLILKLRLTADQDFQHQTTRLGFYQSVVRYTISNSYANFDVCH